MISGSAFGVRRSAFRQALHVLRDLVGICSPGWVRTSVSFVCGQRRTPYAERRTDILRSCLLAALGLTLAAEEGLGTFKPNVRYSTFDAPGVRIHVPADRAAALRPLVERAVAVYARMQADAGWTPERTLHLVLTDDEDAHNGFSTVVPLPLVNVQLGPARPESGLFTGEDEPIRTFVHELGHHLSNDRNHGWRGRLESVFGRVLPNEPLSLLVFLLSTPNHVLSPGFWHEGVAQWAETAYADPASAWGGRGRDSLTHMAWRLDAAAGAVAPADEWRLAYERWPYGNRAYLYGLAYTRWLSGAFGDRRGLWRVVEDQGRLATPFAFEAGSLASLGYAHSTLIERARTALQVEQERALAQIRSVALTQVPRLTPPQWRVAAPAWQNDQAVVLAGDGPHGAPRLMRSTPDAPVAGFGGRPAWSMGGVRRIGDGWVARAEAAVGGDRFARSQIELTDGRRTVLIPGERLMQPDARAVAQGWDVVAIQLVGAGEQHLVLARSATASVASWTVVPTTGRPWSPAFQPSTGSLCWVETDREGSRLVLAGPDGTDRRVLWQVRGRILHPVWDAAGGRIFCASDVSGVLNGWCVDLSSGQARPVTNTLGGVLAVVPSPDGTRLAVIDHDAEGPFLGIVPLDPASWPERLPQVELAWPAPVERQPLGPEATGADRADPAGPVPEAGPALAEPVPYSGLRELRLRFWTPTTMVVPEGGFGAVAVATDALLTHTVIASAGRSFHEKTPVGLFSWTYNGWNPGLGLVVKRAELDYNEQILASDGRLYDYDETVDTIEGRIGYGLGGFRRRWQAWLAVGLDDHQPVDSATDDYAGLTTAKPDPFVGSERYVEATIAYDDSLLFPTSYAREDGPSLALVARASDPRGNRLLGQAGYSFPVWPEQGHQLLVSGQLGWSDGPHDLQSRFWVGGDRAMGNPRGYPLTMARGRTLESWSAAYRLPVWRPFDGAGTTPWVTRQVVLEGFYDAARCGDQLGEGFWFRSVGVEAHLEFEFWLARFAPGVGVARQVDGLEDTAGYLSLGFRW